MAPNRNDCMISIHSVRLFELLRLRQTLGNENEEYNTKDNTKYEIQRILVHWILVDWRRSERETKRRERWEAELDSPKYNRDKYTLTSLYRYKYISIYNDIWEDLPSRIVYIMTITAATRDDLARVRHAGSWISIGTVLYCISVYTIYIILYI